MLVVPRAHVALLDLIARLDLSPSTDEVLFSLCRLLFYMTLDGDVQRELRDNMNAVSLLADVFANRTSVCEPGLLATAASPVCSEMCSALAELLHVLFALGSSRQCQADCQPVWKRITPSLLTLLMADGNDLLQLPHSQLVELPRTKHFALMLGSASRMWFAPPIPSYDSALQISSTFSSVSIRRRWARCLRPKSFIASCRYLTSKRDSTRPTSRTPWSLFSPFWNFWAPPTTVSRAPPNASSLGRNGLTTLT